MGSPSIIEIWPEEDKVEVTTTSRLQSKKLKNDLFLRSFKYKMSSS